jgi:hypothetical protein
LGSASIVVGRRRRQLSKCREPRLHLTNAPNHIEAGLMLNLKVLIDLPYLGLHGPQRIAALSETGRRARSSIPRVAQLLEAAHRVMDRPQLGFQLRHEIQLMNDDNLDLCLEPSDGCGRIRMHANIFSKRGMGLKLSGAEVWRLSTDYMSVGGLGGVSR